MARGRLNKQGISNLINYLNGECTPSLQNLSASQWCRFKTRAESFRLDKDTLYYYNARTGRLLQPIAYDDEEQLKRIFHELHDLHNHPDATTLYTILREKYIGVSRKKLQELVMTCSICRARISPKQTTVSRPIVCHMPWWHVQVEYIDMRLHRSANRGYRWILVVLDIYSGHLIAWPLRLRSMACVYDALLHIFNRRGTPHILQTANSNEFLDPMFKSYMDALGIRHMYLRCERLQNLEQVREAARIILQALCQEQSSTPDENSGNTLISWLDRLDSVVVALNQQKGYAPTASHEATEELGLGWSSAQNKENATARHKARYSDSEEDEVFEIESASDSICASMPESCEQVPKPDLVYQWGYLNLLDQDCNVSENAPHPTAGDKVANTKNHNNKTGPNKH
ncbi:hypothetical protein NEHOM01_1177 [Nematocida homosporus]|uniref:uncharacterized protein n=1 Tax=Nematocida homosporus TaxID=1912981 RepID=UPI00221FF75E|nr:uncharacterized protein NEHOM01_1177 [Nematocida homosporus]KAI5185954.1 hypothetical protein NEHOM01_1177 [Nematocida homosporus]